MHGEKTKINNSNSLGLAQLSGTINFDGDLDTQSSIFLGLDYSLLIFNQIFFFYFDVSSKAISP